jgi:hydroxyacylglutathione hydrolase
LSYRPRTPRTVGLWTTRFTLRVMLQRFICGRARSNAYVYAAEDGRALIVDAGVGAASPVIDLVRAEGLQPQALLLTHGHPDHIWQARELADRYEVPAYIHTDDIVWFTDPATGARLPVVRTAGRLLARSRRLRPADLRAVADGQAIEAGPFRVRVLHTPGHSRGSACLVVDELCFAGDTVFKGNIGRVVYPGGDRAALRESIRTKLLPLPDDLRVYPGHGGDTSVAEERNGWLRYVGGRGSARRR